MLTTDWALIFLLHICSAAANNFTFPRDFLFGAATAAYQIEGAWNTGGRKASIWDTVTHKHAEYIADLSNGDIAADSYHKYREDVELLKDLGVDVYRFSISWSRVLPTGFISNVNKEGVDYYNNLINLLLKSGIQPMVTMYHWDLPQTLQDLGGWANEFIAEYFEDYARFLYKTYGDRVKWWITINEPFFVAKGYADSGEKAPNVNLPGIGDYLATKTILLAHSKAYHLYDKEFRKEQQGKISIALNINWYEPRTSRKDDTEAADRAIQFEMGLFSHPIFSTSGDYPPVVRERVAYESGTQGLPRSRLPHLTRDEINSIKGTWDFFALNHYTSYWAESGLKGTSPSRLRDSGAVLEKDPSCPTATSTWLAIVPWGFRKMLRWIKDNYNNPPVFVTENGYSGGGDHQDTGRCNYYVDYMREMLKAMKEDRCKVIGYVAWSLLDNFQWNAGYQERFGLYHVNFSDPSRPRTAKASALLFREITKTKEVPERYPLYNYGKEKCRPTIQL